MPAVGLEPERPLLRFVLRPVVARRPLVARPPRLFPGRRGQRLEPLFLVDMKPIVCEADWLGLLHPGFDGWNVTEQFIENAAPLFARRLGCGWLRRGLLRLVLEQRMPGLDRVTMPRFRGRVQEMAGARPHRLGDTVVGLHEWF